MTECRDYDCPECEDREGGCPECNADLARCDSCGNVYESSELDENGECEDCLEERAFREELASDYRRSVL